MKPLAPLMLAAMLTACGQQSEPESSAETMPPPGSATAPVSSQTGPAAPAQQVGMSPSTGDSGRNPTGRGELADAGRGQGPAPGQTGHPAPSAPANAQPVTPTEAAPDCERLAEPQRQECLTKLQRGEAIDDAREGSGTDGN